MSSIVTGASTEYIANVPFVDRLTEIGAIVIILAVAFLAVHQLLAGSSRPEVRERLSMADVAMFPLIIASGILITFRIATFVYPDIFQ